MIHTPSNILALDIGGANLKAADGCGFAVARSFPLWRQPDQLEPALREIIAASPPAERIVATMTGELADCFRTKREGVEHIVRATVEAAGDRTVSFYAMDGVFVSADEAIAKPHSVAAANWHALATFAGTLAPEGVALLLDVGGTTTDVIPIVNGRPAAEGTTDTERLAAGELIYTGVLRSPVCALVRSLPWRGRECPVAQEYFATTQDVYLLLGEIPDTSDTTGRLLQPPASGDAPCRHETPDGRPATRAFAAERLARMICADREAFDEQDARQAALAIREAQESLLAATLKRKLSGLPSPPGTIVISGSGEFLVRGVIARLGFHGDLISLSDSLGPDISHAAPAHALGVLARGMTAERMRTPRSTHTTPIFIIKVGGSLFGFKHLRAALSDWLARHPTAHHVLIPGGGPLADAIRAADRLHVIGEEAAHWICVDALGVTARTLAGILPHVSLIDDFAHLQRRIRDPGVTILDCRRFLRDVEPNLPGTTLPHAWSVTSDSIAARLAEVLFAERLVLMKSRLPESKAAIAELANDGYLDKFFPQASDSLDWISFVNLRAGPRQEELDVRNRQARLPDLPESG